MKTLWLLRQWRAASRRRVIDLALARDSCESEHEMDIHLLLQPGVMLVANPYRYDYIHDIELKQDGTVEMVDGGCQVLRRRILGRYEINVLRLTEAEVRFYDLRDVDPYRKSTETRDLPVLHVRAVLEEGPFVQECEVVWNVKDEDVPYVIFQQRLAFERDPHALGQQEWPEFPPEAFEIPEIRELIESNKRHVENSRRYYVTRDRVEMPYHEIVKRGLPVNSMQLVKC